MYKRYLSVFLGLIFLFACKSSLKGPITSPQSKNIYRVFPSQQQEGGDAQRGLDYISYGDAVGNGVPLDIFNRFFGKSQDTVLNREGDNSHLPYFFTAFESSSKEMLVSGNCFTCHAGELNGKVVLGLGNSLGDFTRNMKPPFDIIAWMIKRKYGKDSEVWKNYEEQHKWYQQVLPAIVMPKLGINPAFRIEEASLAFRNPDDLSFKEEANYSIPELAIGTDVPPLWHVKKKNALYFNGSGRGDFTKLLMQVSVLGIHDSTAAREVQQNFKDVLAWLESLEAPKYPGEIDQELALQGKQLFIDNCEKCHGTYGKRPYYPNKIIPIHEVKTDSIYAQYAMNSEIFDWYNESWFGKSADPAQLIPSYGYMAPPLDGIWATAPYLHNGSVPNLESLLESSKRPTYWSRSFKSTDYDLEAVGWKFSVENNGQGKKTYDTSMLGYGNYGHTFGDEFSPKERKAVIEYLKSL
ncbi:MAG: c-type cytochrome [Bacteroidia bacterium]|nr:c-type cytochrome [Bacteroidia bacterium]